MTGGTASERTAGAGGDLSRFADLAGRRLYRRNIFAVTGLAADAQGRAVRRHRQRVDARLAVEDTWWGDAWPREGWPGGNDSASTGGWRTEEVRTAFEEFQDPRRRLVDELLWRWGEADLGCDCPRSLHHDHDLAVRKHVMALEWENGRLTDPASPFLALWNDAAAGWAALLESADFAEHVAHRIAVLDDPRLGGHRVDDFLAGIARLLVSPFAELLSDAAFAPRLPAVCRLWEGHAPFSAHLTELFEEVLEASTQKIDDGVQTVQAKQGAQLFGDAVTAVHTQVLPEFERLDALRTSVPEWRLEGVAHAVAASLNNLAVALLEYHVHRTPTAKQRRTVIDLAEKAYEIAPDRDAEAIKRNWDVIYERFSDGGRRPAGVPASGAGLHEGSPGGDTGMCLFAVLGLIAAVVLGFVVSIWAALLTGFLTFVGIGVVVQLMEWFNDNTGGNR